MEPRDWRTRALNGVAADEPSPSSAGPAEQFNNASNGAGKPCRGASSLDRHWRVLSFNGKGHQFSCQQHLSTGREGSDKLTPMPDPAYLYLHWRTRPDGSKFLTQTPMTIEEAKKRWPDSSPDYSTKSQAGGLMQGGGLYPDWGKKG